MPDAPPRTTLANAPAPGVPASELTPEQVEFYIRAAMHPDRQPGRVVVIRHPLRMYKVPRGLLEALQRAGCQVRVVDTLPDRVASVHQIRDVLLEESQHDEPLDVIVISGDGTLDHHVLVGAFQAFYPDLVLDRAGEISVSPPSQAELERVPAAVRKELLTPLPSTEGLRPDEDTIREIWLLRTELEPLLAKGRSVGSIVHRVGRDTTDRMLRLATFATLFPRHAVLRADGFDLSGLATAGSERLFKGLYPYIRAFSMYPAGTAADNAVFAGTPGWGYAQLSKLLTRFSWLDGLRRRLEERNIRDFVDYFTKSGLVVPERISVVGFDGDWQRLSSHAAGGPAAGQFFIADLTKKTNGLLGYVARIPQVIYREGILGRTIVRVESRTEDGRPKSLIEARLAEGLYTNRAFIAGVGSVPTTGPTSFAGQSSLLVIPSVIDRDGDRLPRINPRAVLALFEGILKGLLARALHAVGLSVGTLAGGGKFVMLLPEHQVAIKEGEEIRIDYMTLDRHPRPAPTQVSGDPFQAWQMLIRSSWAPIPVLGHDRSLLLSSTRDSLADVRLSETYDLDTIYIGGVHYFLHQTGESWSGVLAERSGLVPPPRHLPRSIAAAQRTFIGAWRALGVGEFVDTTPAGIDLGKRGHYAHNNDQTAHLVVVREPGRMLLVRQLRAVGDSGKVYENRTRYRAVGPAWIIQDSQTIAWRRDKAPLLVQEEHYFRTAEEFQREAPTFFPVHRVSGE